ncbi:uncharacterized protein TNIN_413761 [Trichonephila inaurata madagascariensis]|uniref:Uncharacterized protein n=1 Tax=Trichonephila inaurata madagascariensis TaxID=2747483 RepID=A0A8X6XME3_9ARAC|nr:uncharacterized protein TNIN_413761 [Trichonephila inaurata madagascariensis]
MSLKSAFDSCKSTPFSFSVFAVTSAGCISLILALSSPFWLESKPESESNFVSLGLWKVCFREFQNPSIKYDDVFDGCYYFYGHKSENIPNWLQPGWFIFVQCLTTGSLILAVISIGILIFMHFRNGVEVKIFASATVFVFEASSALISFLAVAIFGAMCFERSWIQYPQYNSLSIGYIFAVVGALFLGLGTCLLLFQTFKLRKLLYRNIAVRYHVPHSDT